MNETPAVLVRLSKENFCTILLARTVYLQGVNARTASSLGASLCGENAHALISKETASGSTSCALFCTLSGATGFEFSFMRDGRLVDILT